MVSAFCRLMLITLLLLSVPGFSQQLNVDSMLQIWNNPAQNDTLRMKAIHEIAWKGFINTNPDSAFYYGQQFFEFASERGYRKESSIALNTMGAAEYYRGNLPEAIDYYQKSLEIKSDSDDPTGVASLLNNLASIYYSQGDYARSIQNLTKSLQIKEKLEDKNGIVNALSNIGAIYRSDGNHEKALEYFLKSLELAEELDNPAMIANALNSIGVSYKDHGDEAFSRLDTATGNQMFSHALVHYQRSLAIQEKQDDDRGAAKTLNNIANLLMHQGNYQEALDHHNLSLEIKTALHDQAGIAVSLNNISNVYRKMGQIDRALENSRKALEIGSQSGVVSIERDAAESLYQIYEEVNQFQKALEMHALYIGLRDSINSQENQNEIMHQRFQYEFDKKEALIEAEQEKKNALNAEQLRRKNLERNSFIGGFGIMLLLAGLFFFQRLRIAREKKRSDELLLNILPEETARELKEKGHAEAKFMEDVTVLFTDFVGFTELSAQMNPRELVAEINECFSAYDKIMAKYGIEKIKTIGDAYMAAGGLPTPNATHARNVMDAALEIRDYMLHKEEIRKIEGKPFFNVRIGVHTGSVVAGIVGIKKFQYDIWGDTVNTASRMESSGESGKINISESTYVRIKNFYNCEYRGEIEAKGKGKVGMYFVEKVA